MSLTLVFHPQQYDQQFFSAMQITWKTSLGEDHLSRITKTAQAILQEAYFLRHFQMAHHSASWSHAVCHIALAVLNFIPLIGHIAAFVEWFIANKFFPQYFEKHIEEETHLIKAVMNKHIDIHSHDVWGNTPLHKAAEKGWIRATHFLINKGAGASIEKRDLLGDTALHIACDYGYLHIAAVLIAGGANINAKGLFGETPLHYVVARNKMEMLQLLLDHGAKTEETNNLGYTPLCVACEYGCKDMAAVLIAKGAKVHVKDSLGRTPLHFATMRDHLEIARLLLENDAPITAADHAQPSPLYYTLSMDPTTAISFLLLFIEHGYDINDGIDRENSSILSLLFRNAVNPESIYFLNDEGNKPRFIQLSLFLIEKGALINEGLCIERFNLLRHLHPDLKKHWDALFEGSMGTIQRAAWKRRGPAVALWNDLWKDA